MLLGFAAFLLATAQMNALIRVPISAANLAAPVLNAMIAVRQSENEHALVALDDAVERVCNRTSKQSDEALAVLIEFYVGEHEIVKGHKCQREP